LRSQNLAMGSISFKTWCGVETYSPPSGDTAGEIDGAIMRHPLIYFLLFSALLAVMAAGMTGTGAWFTDQVSIDNNSITTGSINLTATDVEKSTPILEPGGNYQEVLRFCVKNTGTYNMKWRGIFTAVKASDGVEDKLLIKAIINPSKKFSGNYGPEDTVWFNDVPASALKSGNVFILLDSSTNTEPFKPEDRVCYSFQAKLTSGADNLTKKITYTANLQLDATQWINTDSNWSK
jgi:predicted ribosomally synthesized peptide with SipW-like signal peptide